jgi:hypothetical protein
VTVGYYNAVFVCKRKNAMGGWSQIAPIKKAFAHNMPPPKSFRGVA